MSFPVQIKIVREISQTDFVTSAEENLRAAESGSYPAFRSLKFAEEVIRFSRQVISNELNVIPPFEDGDQHLPEYLRRARLARDTAKTALSDYRAANDFDPMTRVYGGDTDLALQRAEAELTTPMPPIAGQDGEALPN